MRIVDKRTGKAERQRREAEAAGAGRDRAEPVDFWEWNSPRHRDRYVSRQELRAFWMMMRRIERDRRWWRRLRRWLVGSWQSWTTPRTPDGAA